MAPGLGRALLVYVTTTGYYDQPKTPAYPAERPERTGHTNADRAGIRGLDNSPKRKADRHAVTTIMGTCTKVTRSPNSRAATYGRPPAWLTTANADKLMTRLPQAQVALISWTAGLIGLTPDSTVPPARLPHTLWTSLTFADEYHRTTVRRTNTNHTKVDRIPPTLHRVTTAATTLHNELALTGISHAIRIERGSQGTQRLHAHALITPTRRRHHIYASDLITEWNRHHGFSHQRRPITGSELTIVAYALKHESREHYLADYTTMIGSWNKQRHVIETIIR